VSPVKYKQGIYMPEDDILYSHCRGNLKSYMYLESLLPSNVLIGHEVLWTKEHRRRFVLRKLG
jgi:hypothetical protein